MKAAWYWHKNRQEDQWNQTEDLNINQHIYKHLIFVKGAKDIKWEKKASLTNGPSITCYQHVEECK